MKNHNLFWPIAFCLLLIPFRSYCQTIPVGSIIWEDYLRDKQIKGEISIDGSYTIRPVFARNGKIIDSVFSGTDFIYAYRNIRKKGKLQAYLLPINLKQQYNTHHPYGWNDGSLIPANGYQVMNSGGIYLGFGRFSFQLQPEIVWAQNKEFTDFPRSFNDSIWQKYYVYLNTVDAPERFGDKPYRKILPGQSSLRMRLGKHSVGISSENLWWGPGVRNSIIMSNNAPGMPHFTINSTSPLKTRVGSFEYQVVVGILQRSGILPPDTSRTVEGIRLYSPKKADDRYLNAMVGTWQPKWTPGLYLGFSRAFYQYRSEVHPSLNGYFPVLSLLYKKNSVDETIIGRDQMISFFMRLVMPESKAELYGEFARNDHSQDSRDLILEPEHARAYTFGAKKFYRTKNRKDIALYLEFTQLQWPTTNLVRELSHWYAHGLVRHGYTHQGQVMGAGIGPGGSNSQTLGISWNKGINKTGFMLERVVRNNDFFYDAFVPTREYNRHWVDLSLNFNRTWQYKQFLMSGTASLVRSYNYQWRIKGMTEGKRDVTNLHVSLSTSYLF